ncbi:6313_t:CDS:2 [Entrophospora sp. SA101]|nr:6313_t:CDS:2 [Entrophospora sp. SA101]
MWIISRTSISLVNKIKGEIQASEDITVQIIKQLIKSLDQFPHKAHLANFLNENPPVKTLLAPNYFSNLVLTDNLSSPPHIDSYHELWDSIIKSTMETFGMHSTSLSTLEFDCCILPFIVNLCPARDSPEFQTIIRPNGTIIELSIDIWGVGDLVSSCNVVGIPQELLSFNLDLCKSDPDS